MVQWFYQGQGHLQFLHNFFWFTWYVDILISMAHFIHHYSVANSDWPLSALRGVEWVHDLFLFPHGCFTENVVATSTIGSFLCSLDNLLQKNEIVLFFGNQISKWRSFWKKGYFWPTFHIFLVTRESYKNSFSTYLTHIHTRILLTLLTFFALPILKKIWIY